MLKGLANGRSTNYQQGRQRAAGPTVSRCGGLPSCSFELSAYARLTNIPWNSLKRRSCPSVELAGNTGAFWSFPSGDDRSSRCTVASSSPTILFRATIRLWSDQHLSACVGNTFSEGR